MVRRKRRVLLILRALRERAVGPVTVPRHVLDVLERTAQGKGFLVQPRDEECQAIALARLARKLHFCRVDLEQVEKGQDEETTQDGNPDEAREHVERKNGFCLERKGVHDDELTDVRAQLRPDCVECNVDCLFVERSLAQAKEGKDKRVDEVIEKCRDMEEKGIGQGNSLQHIERSAKEDDRPPCRTAKQETWNGAKPEQKEQEEWRAKVHAKICERPAEGVKLRLAREWHENQHDKKDEPILLGQ